MSINTQHLTTIINCIDDINRISELQDLLQGVVDSHSSEKTKDSKRIVLMTELYLLHVTPLLQILTKELSAIQMYLIQEKSK